MNYIMAKTQLTIRKERKTSLPKKGKYLLQVNIKGRTSAQQRNLTKILPKTFNILSPIRLSKTDY